jgi:hypothetical protein
MNKCYCRSYMFRRQSCAIFRERAVPDQICYTNVMDAKTEIKHMICYTCCTVTCNKSHVGQSVWSIITRHKEHLRYIRNNPVSAYTLHILHNRHEFGPPQQTLQLPRFFRVCSSVVRQMPGYTSNSQRRGTARTSQIFLSLYCFPFSVLCVPFVCKCVMYYCHRVSTQLRLNKYIYIYIISYHPCTMGIRMNQWEMFYIQGLYSLLIDWGTTTARTQPVIHAGHLLVNEHLLSLSPGEYI